jgi:hypothetical protein
MMFLRFLFWQAASAADMVLVSLPTFAPIALLSVRLYHHLTPLNTIRPFIFAPVLFTQGHADWVFSSGTVPLHVKRRSCMATNETPSMMPSRVRE